MKRTRLLSRPYPRVAALALIVGVVWAIAAIRAAQPQTLDQHVYTIASQIQCPVCHGESVADSPSAVATEIRDLIRKDLQSGMSDQQILTYFSTRYGDTILEVPPPQGFTALMWLGPLAVLAATLFALVWFVRAARRAPALAFSTTATPSLPIPRDPESARLRALLRRELAADEGLGDEASEPLGAARGKEGD
jgi:cytochrome c-type biogenesis protein CcmH